MIKDNSNSIIIFIKNNPQPTIKDLLLQDAPTYDLTHSLAEALIGQKLIRTISPENNLLEFKSIDGTSVLKININEYDLGEAKGLLANDFKDLLIAIRIHEVESYDLVMLPSEMRKANLNYLCEKSNTTPEKIRKLTEIWISQK